MVQVMWLQTTKQRGMHCKRREASKETGNSNGLGNMAICCIYIVNQKAMDSLIRLYCLPCARDIGIITSVLPCACIMVVICFNFAIGCNIGRILLCPSACYIASNMILCHVYYLTSG